MAKKSEGGGGGGGSLEFQECVENAEVYSETDLLVNHFNICKR